MAQKPRFYGHARLDLLITHGEATMGRVPQHLRELVFARSQGNCQKCGVEIELETMHAAHIRSAADGGAEHESNLEAWCQRCNLTQGPRSAGDPRVTPRAWQLDALVPIARRIIRDGDATLSAAPGAGQTYTTLRDLDVVDRLVVIVPRVALVDQWAEALAGACHIQLKPGSPVARRGQDGVVVTYQSLLSRDTIEALLSHPYHARTMFTFDEVHHAGEGLSGQLAWGRAIGELVGDLDHLTAKVLNMSGTLWRSNPGERIPTIRYSPTTDGKLVSRVDYRIDVEDLVNRKELRPLDLYRLGAQVKLADYRDLTYVEGNLADLDEREARATLRGLAGQDTWLESFVAAILDRLQDAHRALNGYWAKALIVADSQENARRFRDEVDRQQTMRNLPRLAEIATSDEKDAHTKLRHFREQKRVGVLCVVDMAGEGYDCPEIAVVGYATNKLTTLYVRQVVARAMRVTDRERELDMVIPAAIVLPDSDLLVEKLVGYLGPYIQELVPPPGHPEYDPGEDGEGGGPRMPGLTRFQLESAAANEQNLVDVAYPDGSVQHIPAELAEALARELERVNVSAILAPRMIAAARRTIGDLIDARPFDPPSADEEVLRRVAGEVPSVEGGKATASASMEKQASMIETQLAKLGRWWAVNGDPEVPVSHFNRMINQAGGIDDGARARATIEQLQSSLAEAKRIIREHCERFQANPPKEVRDDS